MVHCVFMYFLGLKSPEISTWVLKKCERVMKFYTVVLKKQAIDQAFLWYTHNLSRIEKLSIVSASMMGTGSLIS